MRFSIRYQVRHPNIGSVIQQKRNNICMALTSRKMKGRKVILVTAECRLQNQIRNKQVKYIRTFMRGNMYFVTYPISRIDFHRTIVGRKQERYDFFVAKLRSDVNRLLFIILDIEHYMTA
jgi:intergrase/recombinase